MKRTIYILFLFIQFFFLGKSAWSQSIEFTGFLLDSATKQPIASGNIILKESNKHAVSDVNGHFLFKIVKPGIYTVFFSAMGYSTKQQKLSIQQSIHELKIYLNESVTDFNEVVITASRTDQLLKDVPVLTQIVNTQQIQNTGTTNIADAINSTMPGVEFYNEGRGLTFRVQGLSAKYTLFLLDGERFAGENRDNIDYSRLNTSNIDKVEIVKGASSSLYGSSAIGGVVNIITHTPVKPFESNIYGRYSKYNELETGANVGFKKNNFTSFTDFVRKQSSGYDLTPATPDLYTVEPYEIYSVFQKFNYDITPKISLNLHGSYFSRERFDVAVINKHPLYVDFSGGLGSKFKINERFSLTGSFYGDDYKSYDILERLNNEKRKNYDNTQMTGRLIGEYHLKPHKLFKEQNIIGGIEYFSDKMYAERIQDSSKQNHNYVFFMQDEMKMNKRWSSVIGFRTDIHSEFGPSFSPKASLMYTVGKFVFRGTYGYGFRVPSIKERYYDFDLGFIAFQGNKDLKPERSQYASLSTEIQTNRVDYSINIYNTHLKDMILEMPIAGTDHTFSYVNFSKVNIFGIDNMIRHKIIRKLILTIGYSFTYALDMNTHKELIGISKHTGIGGIEYSKRFKKYQFRLAFNGKYYSQKTYQDYADNSLVFVNVTYPDYSIWKLVTIHEFLNGAARVTVGIDNLFNYHKTSDLINIDPGRRVFCQLNLSLDKAYTYFKK